jgi:hypothetical protein
MTKKKLSHWSISPDLYLDFETKVKEVGLKRSQVVEQLLQLWIEFIFPNFED